jgi:hypothetical protein
MSAGTESTTARRHCFACPACVLSCGGLTFGDPNKYYLLSGPLGRQFQMAEVHYRLAAVFAWILLETSVILFVSVRCLTDSYSIMTYTSRPAPRLSCPDLQESTNCKRTHRDTDESAIYNNTPNPHRKQKKGQQSKSIDSSHYVIPTGKAINTGDCTQFRTW